MEARVWASLAWPDPIPHVSVYMCASWSIELACLCTCVDNFAWKLGCGLVLLGQTPFHTEENDHTAVSDPALWSTCPIKVQYSVTCYLKYVD